MLISWPFKHAYPPARSTPLPAAAHAATQPGTLFALPYAEVNKLRVTTDNHLLENFLPPAIGPLMDQWRANFEPSGSKVGGALPIL